MRFLSVRELRGSSARLWKQLSELSEKDPIVITSNGKPVALLSPVDEQTLEREIAAWRRARAMLALDELHRRSVEQGTDRLTEEEIEEEVKAGRAERVRPS